MIPTSIKSLAVVLLCCQRAEPPVRLVVDAERLIIASPSGFQTVTQRDGGATNLYYDAATDLLRGREIKSAVLLGLGGGEMLRQIHGAHPAALLFGVEIDPTTTHLARTVFQVPAAVIEADAVQWVDTPPAGSFSVVIVDLYDDSTLVPAAARLTFLAGCYRLLPPRGLFMMNVWPANRADEIEAVLHRLYPHVERHSYGPNVVLSAEKPSAPL